MIVAIRKSNCICICSRIMFKARGITGSVSGKGIKAVSYIREMEG